MRNEAWIDGDNQVLRQRLIDDAILTEAPEYFAEVKKLMDKLPHRHAIIDLGKADEGRLMKRESREFIGKYSSSVGYKKLAYINFSPSLRVIAKVINKIAVKKFDDKAEIGFFRTEEEALSWLRGHKT